jgi:NAD-dependent DNA ligase
MHSQSHILYRFKEKGIALLDGSSEEMLESMLRLANDQYYNTETAVLTDNEYDVLKEYVERKYPKNAVISEVGATPTPTAKNKVSLPYEMPSMDKIKPDTEALVHWMKSYGGPYVLSCKLDGVSGLYTGSKLYTRGNGKVGQDITHLLSVLGLPKIPKEVVIRGEFILPKSVFKEKYGADFANPRNLVSGIVNSKRPDEKTKDLHFVTYEVVHPPMPPSQQMAALAKWGFKVVQNEMVTTLSNNALSALLLKCRSDYVYEIDGVIVSNDKVYPRGEGNPAHAFAFKMVISDQQAEAKVVDVIWTPSKNGYLKPRVRIEPVHLCGVTIEYATGFNGKFIQDNRIGVGAVIQLVRSGDVIPYITGITTPAAYPKMPLVPYLWTDSRVDILLENGDEDETVLEKNVAGFFTHLEVDGLSSGNVKRIFAAGFRSVKAILKMTKRDFEKVEGFKSKMIEKVYTSIHEKTGNASLLNIMVASNKMGRGLAEKKLRPILEAYPDILTSTLSSREKEDVVKSVKGIGPIVAGEFVAAIPTFLAFLEECGLSYKLQDGFAPSLQNVVLSAETATHPLYGKKVVMTKVRDKVIIEALAQYGATLEDSVKKDTFALIVKSNEDVSNKTEAAKKYGVAVFTPDEFIKRFGL